MPTFLQKQKELRAKLYPPTNAPTPPVSKPSTPTAKVEAPAKKKKEVIAYDSSGIIMSATK